MFAAAIISAAHAATLALWRIHALAIVTCLVPSTPTLRALAWRFLRQWGVR